MKRFHGSSSERIVQALDQEIRDRGHGSIRAVNRAAGRSEGWWQHRAASGDILMSQLLRVLGHLGLEPARFLRRALGNEDELGLDRPRGAVPEIVERAWERFETGEEGALGRPFLDELDEQRYREPEEVVRLVGWGLERVELGLLPRLLGVLGSAWRLLIELGEAEHAVHAGIEMARLRGDRAAVGDLLQRLGYVIADRGDRSEALRLAEIATMIHVRLGNREAVGKALVDQGIWLYNLDRSKEAIETLNIALESLSSTPSRNRFAALQNLGLAHQALGEHSAALRNLEAAQQTMPYADEWARGKLFWLRSKVQADLGQLAEAADLLDEVITIFRGLHHGEAAIATCELVHLQLARGDYETAYEVAISTRSLLEPLRHNRIISAAIGDLLRSGQAGLTLALVERVTAQLASERQEKLIWQSLRIKPSTD